MVKGYKKSKGGNQPDDGGMMQQIQQMQAQMETLQDQLAAETVTASAGGGVVKVTMSGDQICRGVEIDPSLLEDPDIEMLQDLILSAVNLSLDKSRELQNERFGGLTGGLSGMLPGMGF